MSELARTLEALLFLSAALVATGDLCEALDCSADELAEAVAELREALAPGARGTELRELAGGYTLASTPDAEPAGRRLLAQPRPPDRARRGLRPKPRPPPLTAAQAETLAIVAYLQPVSRPEITRIRGV